MQVGNLGSGIDLTQYQPYGGAYKTLPKGDKYVCEISRSEVKANKNGNGSHIVFYINCVEGEFQGYGIIDRINLGHSNPDVVRIAYEQLSAYGHVTGVLTPSDTSDFHGKRFLIDVGPQNNNPEYTEMKALYDLQGNRPGMGTVAPTNQPGNNQAPPAGWGAQAPANSPVEHPTPTPAVPSESVQPAAPDWSQQPPQPTAPSAEWVQQEAPAPQPQAQPEPAANPLAAAKPAWAK